MPLVVIGLMIYVVSPAMSPATVSPGDQERRAMTMRRRLFGHMMGMPVSFFDKQSTVRCCHVLPTIPNRSLLLLPAHSITVVREGALIIGLFIMMFYYSWHLSIDFDCAGTDCFDCDSRCNRSVPQHQ
ncbi:ABC transporter transmembrane domain-containing protein [Shigella boydii]